MKKIIYILFFLFISNTFVYSQSGWVRVNSPAVYLSNSLQVINDNSIVAGGGAFYGADYYLSTDRGISWTLHQGGNSPYSVIRALYFINEQTGYIANASGMIVKTTNRGINWSNYNIGATLESLSFTNPDFGIGVAPIYRYYLTSNGGVNWNSIQAPNSYFISLCINKDTFLLGGTYGLNNGIISATTNAGLNWFDTYFNQIGGIGGLSFINKYSGFAIGSRGYVFYTSNSGINWTQISGNLTPDLWSLKFVNMKVGYIVGSSGHIMKTSDGGANWVIQNSGTTAVLSRVDFLDANTGIVVGDTGIILRTTTGGDPQGIKPISSEVPTKFMLYQNYPNPFNPTTKIKFDVTSNVKSETSNVKLIIYYTLGREVATLVNEKLIPGTYEVEWNAGNYASGVYFYRLTTESFSQTKKLILLK